MRRRGAKAALGPSNDSARLLPEPVIIKLMALPASQPARLTIDCTIVAKSVLLCSSSPDSHAEGDQLTLALVVLLEEIFSFTLVKTVELSTSSPFIVRFVVPL